MKSNNSNKNSSKNKSAVPNRKPPITDEPYLGEEDYPDDVDGGFTEGDEPISRDLQERMEFGFSFSGGEGRSGEEDEDIGDLPSELKKPGNRYDPTMNTGGIPNPKIEDPDLTDLDIKGQNDIGMAYGPDKYTMDRRKDRPEDDSRH